MSVCSLIKLATNEWNLDVLQEFFSPRDISLIESIPLSSIQAEDKVFWPFTSSGSYTVKLGYQFLYKAFNNNEYQPKNNSLWKKVWGLYVQPKIRKFLWWAIKNSIPSKVNLKHRMVISEDCCEQCKGESKDMIHALWSCSQISPIWSQQVDWNFRGTMVFVTFKELVEYVVEAGKDLTLFATIVWTVWHRRNALQTSSALFLV